MSPKTFDRVTLWIDLFAWIGGAAYIVHEYGLNTGTGVFMLAYFIRGRRG